MRYVIDRLREMGFQVVADGDVVIWRWGGEGLLDPAKARPLVESLKARKSEALAILRGDLPVPLTDWPEEWREQFEERAGIMEFDGGLSRAEAERQAEAECQAEVLAHEAHYRAQGGRR